MTLWDLLEIMQGPMQVNTCVAGGCRCPRLGACGASTVWRGLQDQVAGFLRSTPLTEVIGAFAPAAA
jgi:DNA-binding IscR family transcriptional regulator